MPETAHSSLCTYKQRDVASFLRAVFHVRFRNFALRKPPTSLETKVGPTPSSAFPHFTSRKLYP